MNRCALALLALTSCLNPLYEGPVDAGTPPLPAGIFGAHVAPEVVLVVDRSGSMTDLATGGSGCVDTNGNYVNNHNIDCKWNNLVSVLVGQGSTGGMLEVLEVALSASSGADAKLGLITFSNKEQGDSCTPGTVRVAVGTHTRLDIATALNRSVPGGATPTAATMALVPAAFPPNTSPRPDRYAILLTDGVPNCNAGLTPTETSCGGDRCTVACTPSDWANCFCNPAAGGDNASMLCLDDDALVNAVAALNTPQVGIRTFVVGFGLDTLSGIGAATLNRVAQAGGTNAQSMALTQTNYFQANSAQDLTQSLQIMLDQINANCRFSLGQAVPEGVKSVQVVNDTNAASVTTSNYTLDSDRSSLILHDKALCESVRNVGQVRFVFSY